MLGLANMAMDLAVNRAYGLRLHEWQDRWTPAERQDAYDHADIFPAAYHYYVICDRLAAGKKP